MDRDAIIYFQILKLIIRRTQQHIENKFQFKNLSETSDSGFGTNDQYCEPAMPENMRQHRAGPFRRISIYIFHVHPHPNIATSFPARQTLFT